MVESSSRRRMGHEEYVLPNPRKEMGPSRRDD